MSDALNLNLSMFRAYDIRTPAARLSAELAERLARAEAVYFAEELGASTVVLGHDARSTGPRYLTIVSDAFRDAGLDVIYLPGVSSTSHFYYAAMRFPEAAAVMVGASHNPAGDTGQKIVGPGVDPIARAIGPRGGLDRIEALYREGARRSAPRRGEIHAVDLMTDYVEHSLNLAGIAPGQLRGASILADFLFGAAGRELMLAFERAGANLDPLHFAADGNFPLGDPNPVKQPVIAEGLNRLRRGAYQLGFFFDGDGDRIDVYRGDGSYLSSSFVYAAILPQILARCGRTGARVFADLKSNPLAVIEMARAGVTVDVIRNGHSQIKKSLSDDAESLGAVEESAHFYEAFDAPIGLGRFCTENTLYIALLVARVALEEPERLEQLARIQESTAREREWGYIFPSDALRARALDAVKEQFLGEGFAAMERMRNGMDLESTLMRRGLPFDVNRESRLATDWLQICQRVSQSEDRLARWEVVGASRELVAETKRRIATTVATFEAGEEYQG
ncbi:MAG: hypothetical protein U0794_12795 [Isosphaeraceae bacterium]